MRFVESPLPADQPHLRMQDLLLFALRRLREERLPQVAGSLTFTTVLATVPLLTIAFAIFTTFPLFNAFRDALESYLLRNLMPPGIANTILNYLNQFARQATKLSAVGAVALIFTAVAMIGTVDRTLNRIWRVRSGRPFVQRILMYWAVITLGPLLIGVSFSLTGYLFTATNGVVKRVPLLGELAYGLLSLAISCGAFTLLYMVVPNRLVRVADAVSGGLFAALAFEVTKRLFALFIGKFPSYTILYGALAAMPLFLVWIYLGWLITLVGAVISAALPVVRHERWWHQPSPGSVFIDALALLGVLCEARRDAFSAVDANTLRLRTRIGFEESEQLLQQMLDAGWVARLNVETPKRLPLGRRRDQGQERWTLLANPAQLRLADVYRLFAFSAVDDTPLARRVEAAVEQGLQATLEDEFGAQPDAQAQSLSFSRKAV
jgi:membrane protein